ncbi:MULTISPECIES: hypothetical protein [Gordonia]|uniref:Uncharacterized protein n=2 Tax=Gordonia TaxID=2053 RepID=A0A9X3D1Y3_9ACTN|nr:MULTISPECIES: hypothetical protein [Gordonia]MCF3938222.1 hypothetical protein [Gordonia tangerina]MCX2963563.1 hypothetical protein [Gordonia aquimaris]
MTVADPSTIPVPARRVPTTAAGIALACSAPIWAISVAAVGDHEGFGAASVFGGLAALAFQLSVLALLSVQQRSHAMGAGRVARVGYRVEVVVLGGALVSTILDMFWLVHGSVVWMIFDICWPLSMLGMLIIGIRVAIADRWTGALRWQTLFAQSWLVWALPLGAIPGVGLWGAVVQTILGYGGLGLLLARRQVITASAPVSQNPLS